MKSIEVTDTNLEEVLGKEGITVLDFWAPWCAPCRMVGPIMDELATNNEDVQVGKVNIDDNKETAIKFGIRSIPCIVFFKDGEEMDKKVGAQPLKNLQEVVDFLDQD